MQYLQKLHSLQCVFYPKLHWTQCNFYSKQHSLQSVFSPFGVKRIWLRHEKDTTYEAQRYYFQITSHRFTILSHMFTILSYVFRILSCVFILLSNQSAFTCQEHTKIRRAPRTNGMPFFINKHCFQCNNNYIWDYPETFNSSKWLPEHFSRSHLHHTVFCFKYILIFGVFHVMNSWSMLINNIIANIKSSSTFFCLLQR